MFNTSLSFLNDEYLDGFWEIPNWILNIPLGEVSVGTLTLFELMLGVGLPIVIVWSLAKWLTDIVA